MKRGGSGHCNHEITFIFERIAQPRLRESHAVIIRDRVAPARQVPFPGEPSGEPGNGT